MPAAPHPDPTQGVFETLLVVDGRPVELDAHLRRLTGSLRALYGAPVTSPFFATMAKKGEVTAMAEARRLALEASREVRLGRLRLTAIPGGPGSTAGPDGLAVEATSAEIEPALVFPTARTIELAPIEVEGGLGAHKWVDRRLLEEAEAATPDAAPLLLDGDGTVLEASRANVFAVREGALLTPPTDGRIVPGITRARVIALARADREIREERLSLDDLLAADEVFLTNSVRGIEPVGAIANRRPRHVPPVDGPHRYSTNGTSAEGGVSARLASELRRSWLGRAAPAAAAAAAP